MRVDVAFTPNELKGKNFTGQSVVVIDALRATSTMIVAFENGCSAFIPVATVEEAREMVSRNPDYLLAGERGARPLPGFNLGNSPRDYRGEKVRGKVIVMTTTNGTGALVASGKGKEVFIGSFLNLRAVTERLIESGRDVLIACAGEKDVFCLEDTICAGAIIDRLERKGPVSGNDSSRTAKVMYDECQGDIYDALCSCDWGRHLESLGLGKDIRTCARVDSSSLVPVYRDGRIFIDR